MTEEATKRRRAGGRAGNKERAGSSVIDQMPWRIPVNPDRPTEPLDADGVQAIHRGAMKILRDIGIEFLNPDAVEHLKRAGCLVNGTNVRMDEDFVMEMLARAPETFTITPRNVEREVIMGGKHMLFVNVSSPPNALSGKKPACSTKRPLGLPVNRGNFAWLGTTMTSGVCFVPVSVKKPLLRLHFSSALPSTANSSSASHG